MKVIKFDGIKKVYIIDNGDKVTKAELKEYLKINKQPFIQPPIYKEEPVINMPVKSWTKRGKK